MAQKKKSSIRKTVIISIVLVLGVGGAIAAYLFNNRTSATKVNTEKASRRTITQTVSAIGKIKPEKEIKISSEASGEITTLTVKDGDFVQSGQLLIRIRPDLIETQIDQSRAALKAANIAIEISQVEVTRTEAELKRTSELFTKGFASKQEYEGIKAQFERATGQYQSAQADKLRAEASLKQIQVSFSRTAIYAPHSGTVTLLNVELGEKVVGTAQMQGTELMRISDLNVMNAIVDVDENDVVKVKKGDTARIKIDAFPNEVFKGVVYEISNSAKQKGLGTQDEVVNFEVRVRLIDGNNRLRPGMSCSADIETKTHENVISIPLGAVTVRSDGNSSTVKDKESGLELQKNENPTEKKRDKSSHVVFVVQNNKALLRPVETDLSDKGYIEVTNGIKDGDVIITGPFQTVTKVLTDGMVIDIDSTKIKKK